jgi:SM-20-related protein
MNAIPLPTSPVPTEAAPRTTYRYEVDGRPVWVFDDLVPPPAMHAFHDFLRSSPFQRREKAHPRLAEHRHWMSEVPVARAPELVIYQPSLRAARSMFDDDRRHRPVRSYCNHASYGDMLFSHVDGTPEEGCLTALWYVCRGWEPDWGGETLFFNDRADAVCVVSPRAGRLVVFDGAIRHVGRPPNRVCFEPRYTFALKLVTER